MSKNTAHFSNLLILWYVDNKRELPWRLTKEPYNIWLSEIILQQTKVAQGLPYYNAFISTFPSVNDLAKAPEEKVLKLCGPIAGADKKKVLKDADLFLHTSRSEGHPMGVLEALAYGIPCLLTPGTNMASEVAASGAKMLFVAISSPKKENFINSS